MVDNYLFMCSTECRVVPIEQMHKIYKKYKMAAKMADTLNFTLFSSMFLLWHHPEFNSKCENIYLCMNFYENENRIQLKKKVYV